jgi:hypothetical protein
MFNLFGCGVDHDENIMALLRQVLVSGFLSKDIETYGIVKITGIDFIIILLLLCLKIMNIMKLVMKLLK